MRNIAERDLRGDCYRLNTVLNELDEKIDSVSSQSQTPSDTKTTKVLYGASGERVDVKNVAIGSLWVDTLENVIYQVRTRGPDAYWAVVYGTMTRSQADLAALAAKLTTDDVGLLVYVPVYNHILRWNGTAYEFAPGDGPGGYIRMFAVDPSPSDGWALLNGGAATTYLKADGSTGSYSPPDLVSTDAKAAYAKLGKTAGGPHAAVAPGVTFGAVNTSSDSAGTPTGTVSQPSFSGSTLNTGTNSSSWTFSPAPSGGSVTVAANGHVHQYTPTGTVSQPSFSGSALANHSHSVSPTGTIDDTAEPRNLVLRPWFRR